MRRSAVRFIRLYRYVMLIETDRCWYPFKKKTPKGDLIRVTGLPCLVIWI